jgi:hypothetical protein
MQHFTVRFELESNDQQDYTSLEERLILFNFTEIIESEDGETYILPKGEYRISGEFNRQKVLDLAILAAAQFKDKCKIVVTESNGTAWTGLAKA